MATITESDLSQKYWCTSEQVQDRFELEVQNQVPDFEQRIIEATDAIQADWADITGQSVVDAPSDPPELLQYATADLAASFAHLNYAANVSGDSDQRHVFLEKRSEKMFDRWKNQSGLDPGDDTTDEPSETVDGLSGVIGGEDSSPVYRGDD